MLRFLLLMLFCLWGFGDVTRLAAAATIDTIRFGNQSGDTRAVIELDQTATYIHDILPNPPRLIVDLDGTYTYRADPARDSTGLINDVRFGQPDTRTSRIVFDLNSSARVLNHFILPPAAGNSSHRLVFDLSKQGVASANLSVAPINDFTDTPIPTPSPPEISLVEPPKLQLGTIERTIQTTSVVGLPTPKPPYFSVAPPKKKYVIVLDAGHGGGDPGGIGHSGVREKDIVLAISQNLKKHLEEDGRYEVHLTRTSDYYIKLRERFQRARDMNANMFISIHADKLDNASVRGASVYTLSETASDTETARLAQQENNAGLVAGVDLAVEDSDVANILLDLVRRETLNESKLFAELLVESLRQNQVRSLNNPHRYAGFAVLKAPDIPSVLIEAGFLSNREDTMLLKDETYHNRLSGAVKRAIDDFFERIERLNME